jgi:DNA-binding response OmpR family regulator
MVNAARAGSLPSLVPGNSDRVAILIVDDNTSGAQTLSMLLDLDGYAVSIANCGKDALERFLEVKPSIILLDIGLPDMSGYDVAREIRAMPEGQEVTIMAVTGWGSERDRALAQSAGCDLHLTKPVNFDRLERLLKGEEIFEGATRLSRK